MTEAGDHEQAADSLGGDPTPAGADAGPGAHADAHADAQADADTRADARTGADPVSRRGRPFLERIGMAMIALVLALLFGAMALAAFAGGEPFLGAMAGIGCLMTLWVGGLTLVRG